MRSASGSDGASGRRAPGHFPVCPHRGRWPGRRRIARQDFEVDPLGSEEGHRLGGVRPQLLGEDDQPERPYVVGERWLAFAPGQWRSRADRQHAPSRARLGERTLGERRVSAVEQLRRAEDEPLTAQVERAPAPA